MKRMIKYLPLTLMLIAILSSSAQARKAIYHPCFLMDSVDVHLDFIKQNAARVFADTLDCKETLLDSIAQRYTDTKSTKYLEALSAIRQNPNAKVEDLYTDIVKRFIENDFAGFLDRLYLAKGKFLPLQNELIAAMNMIVDGRPLKQKYLARLNAAIEKAKGEKDKYKEYYLEKLKIKIDEEKYR
jgi:hypothetical protein